MEFTVRAALERHRALGIRPVTFDVIHHPQKDGGVRNSGVQMLNLQMGRYEHGLILLDWEGCGSRHAEPVHEEESLNQELKSTWGDRARAIVIEPELDVWIWGSDQALVPVLEWRQEISIREYVQSRGFELEENQKPRRPKEAFESLLALQKLSTSASLYQEIASRISLAKCSDPSFIRLKEILWRWFAN